MAIELAQPVYISVIKGLKERFLYTYFELTGSTGGAEALFFLRGLLFA